MPVLCFAGFSLNIILTILLLRPWIAEPYDQDQNFRLFHPGTFFEVERNSKKPSNNQMNITEIQDMETGGEFDLYLSTRKSRRYPQKSDATNKEEPQLVRPDNRHENI